MVPALGLPTEPGPCSLCGALDRTFSERTIGMPFAEALIQINRSPAEVFALLDNTSRAPEWLESCVAIRRISPGPKGVGATLHYSYRQGSRPGVMDGIVTAYTPGTKLGMRFTDSRFAVDVGFDLGPVGAGTQVRHECRITPASIMGRLMTPLIQLGNRRQVHHNLARLKTLLEAGPGMPPAS